MFKKTFLAGLLTVTVTAFAGEFKLTSTDLKTNAPISQRQARNGSGCTGMNISPQLSWSGTPSETKSFAVTMVDVDARWWSWWHWVVLNIPANVNKLDANAGNPQSHLLPIGAIQGRSDFGNSAYNGPCPPKGEEHRYLIIIYALKNVLPPQDSTSKNFDLSEYLQQNTIASASIASTYELK